MSRARIAPRPERSLPLHLRRAGANRRIRSTCIGSIHRGDLTVRSNGPKYRSEASNWHIPGYHELLGESVGRNRSGVLELAVLGLLNGTPMHGYELRKRLYTVLGAFRALSYGSLYPCLHELQAAGLITAEQDEPSRRPPPGRRGPGRAAGR